MNRSANDFTFRIHYVLMSRMVVDGSGDWGSIPSQVIPKTQKMVLDTSLLTLSIIRYGSKVK